MIILATFVCVFIGCLTVPGPCFFVVVVVLGFFLGMRFTNDTENRPKSNRKEHVGSKATR